MSMLTPLFRKGILSMAQTPAVATFVRRNGMRIGAARFVAGETIDQAVPVLRRLNEQGLHTNTTLLGEGIKDEAATGEVVAEYERVLDRIAVEGLRTNLAMKLSHLGLDVSQELADRNLEQLVAHAAQQGNFIRIDMEESWRVDVTLSIYRRLRAAGHSNVGVVLQSALYRSADDLEALLPLCPNLRLVKGAYLESPAVAYPKKVDVDQSYIRLAERSLMGEGYTAIATHDERIIEHVIRFADQNGIGKERFEFQMLYGVRQGLQLAVVQRGYKVLVATPYGPQWYLYLMRRLAERPANMLFLLRNLVRR